jgi:hypothetical protein
LKLGATITTPSLALQKASGGTDYASLMSNNVYVDSTTGNTIDILASDRQEGLPVDYKTPFSIAVGLEYRLSDETLVHFMAEWFAPFSTYVVMQPESDNFIRNSPATIRQIDSAELLKVYDSMKSVLNAGIAVEHKLNEKFTGYAAIRTDFSNANLEDIDGLFIGFTDFNIYHFTAGTSFEMDNTFIGVGFEYSHGERDDFPQIFNFPTGQVQPGDIVLFGTRGTSQAIYNNFNLFFGVTQTL